MALALISAPRATRAAESYDNCTGFITSVPAVITTSGTWCLKKDLNTAMSSGHAITVSTNNVTIDCNDFKLGGLAAGLGTVTHGVFALDRSNVTVRHCNIRGFLIGVFLSTTGGGNFGGGHLVEDNRFDGNTFKGLDVTGDGSVIRRNRILDTGGNTTGIVAEAIGLLTAYSADILDNTVSGVVATNGGNGAAYGILASQNSGGSVSGNRVRELVKDGSGIVIGIQVDGNRITLRNNELVGDGSAGSQGLSCQNTSSRAIGNVSNGFVSGLSGCSNDGNVIAP
jgi:hypothetical protein